MSDVRFKDGDIIEALKSPCAGCFVGNFVFFVLIFSDIDTKEFLVEMHIVRKTPT